MLGVKEPVARAKSVAVRTRIVILFCGPHVGGAQLLSPGSILWPQLGLCVCQLGPSLCGLLSSWRLNGVSGPQQEWLGLLNPALKSQSAWSPRARHHPSPAPNQLCSGAGKSQLPGNTMHAGPGPRDGEEGKQWAGAD